MDKNSIIVLTDKIQETVNYSVEQQIPPAFLVGMLEMVKHDIIKQSVEQSKKIK